MDNEQLRKLQEKYRILGRILDERGRRIWAAAEARSLAYGGVSLVAQATGLSRTTIHAGIGELELSREAPKAPGRIRKLGGGRKRLISQTPGIIQALDDLVEPTTRGDPQSPLRWTCKSTRRLAEQLQRQGYRIGDRKVADLLHQMRYSLQANAKTIEGKQHPDRNAQARVHQRTDQSLSGAGSASHFGGYEKEGAGGQLQERRPGMAPAGRTRTNLSS